MLSAFLGSPASAIENSGPELMNRSVIHEMFMMPQLTSSRFTKDIEEIDLALPISLQNFLYGTDA